MADRFKAVYGQGEWGDEMQIWVDLQTGVNYLLSHSGGMTVLVDENGKPIVTKEVK